MLKLIKNLLSSNNQPSQPIREAAIEYNGYQIEAAPKQDAAGWSTEAYISKIVDGETKTHHFIRADKTASRDGALDTTLNKSRMAIDQLGDNLFGSN